MNILSISSDKNIFRKSSSVRERQISFGHLVDELHIIVFAKKSLGLAPEQISDNTWIYPTNSYHRFLFPIDAIRIGLKLRNFDLISVQDPFESGFVGMILSWWLKKKLHVQVHTDFLNSYFLKEKWENFIRLLFVKLILKRADGIRVVSVRIKKSLKKLNLKTEPDVLPVFVDLDKIKSTGLSFDLHEEYPQFEKIVVTSSRLEKEKNLKLAILTVKDVLKKHPETGYIIIGEGSLKNSLKELVKKEGLEKNIIFVGWQKNPALFYKTADIYLSTSNYEGYGLSMLEAVLINLPVVSTDVGIAGDALLNNVNSLICPVGDKKCLVKSLNRFLEKEETLKLFKKNNEKIIDNLLPQFEHQYFENYRKSWLKALN